MKKYKGLKIFVYVLISAMLVGIAILCWVNIRNSFISLGISVALLFCFIMVLLVSKLNNKQNEELISDLSDLISSISSMSPKIVFPEFEDGLLSKLQGQIIRLTEILKNQNLLIEKEKNDIKSLISDIAHQLKTPVATVKMYGELMLYDNAEPEEYKQYLEKILFSLDKLVFLTESLIKLSRLESGVIALKKSEESLNSTILEAVMQVFDKAVKKNIEIVFDSDKLNVTLMHDKKWTAEAIFNILDNAVKYSQPNGKVLIELQKYEMFARLDITDNGIGIKENEINKIFSRFYRGENAQEQEGVGVGLYLSRQIISQQGGCIKAKSDDKKTVFTVLLPL